MIERDASTDPATLSRLVGMIYDCALDPLRWEETLAELRAALRFCNAMFTIWTAGSGRQLLNVTSGISADYAASLAGFGPAIVEQWGGAAAINAFAIGEPKVLSRERSAPPWQDGPYFREWIAPQGISDLMAVAITREQGNYCSVGFARHASQGPIADAEIDLVRLLAPHIRRAASISRLLDMNAVTVASFTAVLDATTTPILMLDESLGIVHGNRASRDLLAERDGISEAHGRLTLSTAEQMQALRSMLAGRGDQAQLGDVGRIALARSAGPALLHVLPMRHGPFRSNLTPRAAGAVFVASSTSRSSVPHEALAALYDLTPAESRVLVAIASGATPRQAALQLGVGVGTTRTHLLRLFAKTGTSRQADLVRLVAALAR